MFDEIIIKEMSPIDAYNYGRQMAEKELNKIHLCECKQIRADTIDDCIKTLAESEDTILSDRQYYTLIELKEQK